MKRNTILAMTLALTLFTAGCGAEAPAAASSNSSSTVSESKTEDAATEEIIAMIQEKEVYMTVYTRFIPNGSGGGKYEEQKVTFLMHDPTIDEITKENVTAHGILCDEFLATADEITVTYHFEDTKDKSKGFHASTRTSTETVYATPLEPFTPDVFYENFEFIALDKKDGTERVYVPLESANVTFTLIPENWYDNFTYRGPIYATDADGNQYKTSDKSDLRYFKMPDVDWKWYFDISGGDRMYFSIVE